ncbi:hypothetical protein L2E82_28416 [Cichorium intybus]|uniref:Uncharacterized protein n=1 Tax=Cichorium intybus TaxID=13427 RepID=A0ACB9CW24_CICIN|nr:hypothetical protein L2E82_28416 [Cichorium intybus]
MSWIRSAMNKAAEVPGGAIFRAAVRTYTDSFVQHAGYSAPRNMYSFSEAARRLEEASVSCKGEERVKLLRRWLVALKEFEIVNESSVDIDGKSSEDPSSPSDKNVSPKKLAMVLYHDPDLGSSPMNFREVFLQSQALEGMTVSLILGAPNEEEILLIHEIFGLCLAGGKEVHDVVVKNIKDLAKAFSVYDVEMLVRREELLQFAQTAITGLKVTGDIARIDYEISQIQQKLNRMECQKSAGEGCENSSESTSNTSLKIEVTFTEEKIVENRGYNRDTYSESTVDILKVLIESLHNSASKTEKRILEHREEKKEALTFRVARTDEVSQIEKEVGAEISVLEKQRDKLEAELKEVNSTLAIAYTRLQNAREERFQFDEDNNEFLLLLKEKEEELSMTIVSYRAEADTCHAFVNFLEATWAFQSSHVEQIDKQVNDQLQNHEVYLVNATSTFLSSYKDQLPSAIANVRKLEESLKGYINFDDTSRQKPYIPLGGSPENSPLSINATSAEQRKIFDEKDVSNFSLGCEDESVSQKTSDQECPTTVDSSDEMPKLPLTGDESGGNNDTTETVHGEISQVLTGGDVKSVDSNEELLESTSRTEKEMLTN